MSVQVRLDEAEDGDAEVRRIAARALERGARREGFGSTIAQEVYDDFELEVEYLMAERGWHWDRAHASCEACAVRLAADQGVGVGETVTATMAALRETDIGIAAAPKAAAEKARRRPPPETRAAAPEPDPARPPSPDSPKPPEPRVSLKEAQALYAAFKKAEMARLRKAHPAKSPSDLRDAVFQAWQRSDDNPKNGRGRWTPVVPAPPPPADAAGDADEPAVEWVGA